MAKFYTPDSISQILIIFRDAVLHPTVGNKKCSAGPKEPTGIMGLDYGRRYTPTLAQLPTYH